MYHSNRTDFTCTSVSIIISKLIWVSLPVITYSFLYNYLFQIVCTLWSANLEGRILQYCRNGSRLVGEHCNIVELLLRRESAVFHLIVNCSHVHCITHVKHMVFLSTFVLTAILVIAKVCSPNTTPSELIDLIKLIKFWCFCYNCNSLQDINFDAGTRISSQEWRIL